MGTLRHTSQSHISPPRAWSPQKAALTPRITPLLVLPLKATAVSVSQCLPGTSTAQGDPEWLSEYAIIPTRSAVKWHHSFSHFTDGTVRPGEVQGPAHRHLLVGGGQSIQLSPVGLRSPAPSLQPAAGLMVDPRACGREGALWRAGERGLKDPQSPRTGEDGPLPSGLPAPENGASSVLLTAVTRG